MKFKTGDKYKWYDGAGIWGFWKITIDHVEDPFITYTMVNEKLKETQTITITIEDAERQLTRTDGWEWEKDA